MGQVAGGGARGPGAAGSPGGQPSPAPRIGRKDLQDPDRDVTEPDRPDPAHDEKPGDSPGRR